MRNQCRQSAGVSRWAVVVDAQLSPFVAVVDAWVINRKIIMMEELGESELQTLFELSGLGLPEEGVPAHHLAKLRDLGLIQRWRNGDDGWVATRKGKLILSEYLRKP